LKIKNKKVKFYFSLALSVRVVTTVVRRAAIRYIQHYLTSQIGLFSDGETGAGRRWRGRDMNKRVGNMKIITSRTVRLRTWKK
jgi:hypothetical protein